MRSCPQFVLFLFVASACHSGTSSQAWVPTPSLRLDVEHRWKPLYRSALKAEFLRGQGMDEEAEEIVRRLIAQEPLFVPAWRLHQDYLRERGRMARVWQEAEELRERFPDDPEPVYLATRLLSNFEEKVESLNEAYRHYPDSYWILYGLAWCRSFSTDPGQKAWAREVLRRLLKSSKSWPQTWVLYFQSLSSPAEAKKAVPALRKDAEKHPESAILSLLLYQQGSGRLRDLIHTMDRGPKQLGLLSVLASASTSKHRRAVLRHIEAHPLLESILLESGGSLVMAELALAEGRVHLAEEWLSEAARSPRSTDSVLRAGHLMTSREVLILLMLDQGRLGDAIDVYEASLPAFVRKGWDNLEAKRMSALLDGPLRGQKGCPTKVEDCVASLRILQDAGWVDEAQVLGRFYSRTYHGAAALQHILDAGARFLRFEAELVELLRRPEIKDWDLQRFLTEARKVSVEIFGQDRVGEPRIHQFPVLGLSFMDPIGPGLPSFFARYNRYFIVGQGLGKGVQFLIARKLGETRLRRSASLPLKWECREILVENKRFTNLEEGGMMDPAGVALWHHYLLDLQMVRAWWRDLLDSSETMAKEGLADILDESAPDVPALSPSRPCQVDRKITAMAVAEVKGDHEELWRQVFGLLRRHERAHLVEAHRMLPVMNHPFPAIGMALRGGFSASDILAQAEGRAECAAIAHGANPRLGLAHLTSFLPDPGGPRSGPHSQGFQEVLRRMVELWDQEGAPGARRPDSNLYAQLHLMPRDKITEYAKKVSRQIGFD